MDSKKKIHLPFGTTAAPRKRRVFMQDLSRIHPWSGDLAGRFPSFRYKMRSAAVEFQGGGFPASVLIADRVRSAQKHVRSVATADQAETDPGGLGTRSRQRGRGR